MPTKQVDSMELSGKHIKRWSLQLKNENQSQFPISHHYLFIWKSLFINGGNQFSTAKWEACWIYSHLMWPIFAKVTFHQAWNLFHLLLLFKINLISSCLFFIYGEVNRIIDNSVIKVNIASNVYRKNFLISCFWNLLYFFS